MENNVGAFSTGIGSTDMAAVFATGKLWFRVPETFRFEIEGKLPERVYSKDLILHLIGDVGVEGARYMAAEYAGSTIRSLSIPERMTISNMAIVITSYSIHYTKLYEPRSSPGFQQYLSIFHLLL